MGEADLPAEASSRSQGGVAPAPAPQQITSHLTLQAPLSRRGHGPGLILVVDHYAELKGREGCVDPAPLMKWAEEGFAVVMVLVPGKVDDGGEFPLQRAIEALRGLKECDDEGGFGLISYLSRLPFYVEEAVYLSPDIKGIVSYGGRKFTSIDPETQTLPPQLIHIGGPETPRRESMSIVQEPATSTPQPPQGLIKTHRYLAAQRDTSWILPSDDAYHKQSASLAHSRSLQFLKPLLNGPYFDLEAIWEEHCLYEFELRHVEKTMQTMVAEPYVNHIPTMTGGIGKERLTAFYTNHFIFSNPDDTSLDLVSRSVGADRVIDEFVFKFTHDRIIEWLLPGIPPTYKVLEIPFTSIVAMRGDRLCHEHILWDQGTALRQAGLLEEWVRFPYEIEGKKAGKGKRFEVRVPVAGVESARKLVDEGSVESNGLMEGRWREVDDV
ncbi:dienelactone hydrolase-like protein [Massarina eburnea CBS 473.64]|uniref:Dienelactone hydrolase-like protein n=1 Tax=Massarina eburnea CBS 473.64 TaxID=1395130 RepID=A0A6A6RMJ5_9PLEO|nr:dienelactone hydrolase-like protein [Massarina eburnea CBS 473.64]